MKKEAKKRPEIFRAYVIPEAVIDDKPTNLDLRTKIGCLFRSSENTRL
jgi:hypothetical protein